MKIFFLVFPEANLSRQVFVLLIYRMITTNVSKRCKKRTTDQNDAKFEWNIIEEEKKCMIEEKK